MAFSLSGSIITQSGTDTDLSGLSSITGVVTTAFGSHLKIYDLDTANLHLHIEGTLTIGGLNSGSTLEMLVIRGANSSTRKLEVKNGGVLNLGYVHTSGGDDAVLNNGTLIFQPSSTALSTTNYSYNYSAYTTFGISSGGTLNWFSGIVDINGAMGAQSGSNVNIGNGIKPYPCLKHDRVRGGVYFEQIFYCYTTGLNVNGFRLQSLLDYSTSKGSGFVMAAVPTMFKNYEPIFMSSAITGSFSIGAGTYPLEDYSGNPGSGDDLQTNAGAAATLKLINPKLGSSLDVDIGNNNLDILVVQEVRATASDLSTNTALIDGKTWLARDDGSNAQIVSNDGAGNYDFGEVTVAFSPDGQVAGADLYFGAADDTTVRHISYSTAITSVPAILRGAGGTDLTFKTSPDSLITETSKATVDAYTEIDTSAKLYDRVKSYLVDNYAGESAPLVSRIATTIDAGAYDITIDATASQAFAVSGNLITIKASTFVGSITTTGTVTLSNGAAVDGTVRDTTGVTVKITTNTSDMSFYGTINGVEIAAYAAQLTSKSVQLQDSDTLRFVVSSHGYKPKFVEMTTADLSKANVILEADPVIDTTVSAATKNAVEALITVELEPNANPALSQVAIVITGDAKQYTPREFLAGFDWAVYLYGDELAKQIVASGVTGVYRFFNGGVDNYSPNFYTRLSNTITTQIQGGYYIPIKINDAATGVNSVRANTSGLMLGTALWTQATATIGLGDITRIQEPLAKEATLNSKATTINNGVKKASLLVPHTDNV